jgi:hypothetical protein
MVENSRSMLKNRKYFFFCVFNRFLYGGEVDELSIIMLSMICAFYVGKQIDYVCLTCLVYGKALKRTMYRLVSRGV